MVPRLIVVLVPSFLLFDNLMADPAGWFTVAWVLVLGLLAAMPIGMVIGALVKNTQKVGTWGMLPVLVLAGISGIFYPMQVLWTWVRWVAQVFPMYWIGQECARRSFPRRPPPWRSAGAGDRCRP